MSISTPPPPQRKNAAAVVSAAAASSSSFFILLFAGLVVGVGYFGYKELLGLTSTTAPANVPAFIPSDSDSTSVQQKITDFGKPRENHQSASIHLTADEINTLIAHDPDMAKKNIQHLRVDDR